MKSFFNALIILACCLILFTSQFVNGQPAGKNLARVAAPSGSIRFGTALNALNDDLTPVNTGPMRTGAARQPQQFTTYPWNGKVSVTVNPKKKKLFTLYVRAPDRTTSKLYTHTPEVRGLRSFGLNGKPVPQDIVNGYARITRKWKKGDRVEFEIPLEIQTITADVRIEANRGRIALRYGPLIYNVEKADQPDLDKYIGAGPLMSKWRPDFLNGVMTIEGKWEDGTPLVAIPNFVRNNRNAVRSTYSPRQPVPDEGSVVWVRKQ